MDKTRYNSDTAKAIMTVFNDLGEWDFSRFESGFFGIETERTACEKNGRFFVYRLSDCYTGNGRQDVNFKMELVAYRFLGENCWSGEPLASVKIPFDASERVVKNRFEKMKWLARTGKWALQWQWPTSPIKE